MKDRYEHENTKPIIIVVGAAYGSEAKGTAIGQLAIDRNVELAVRTGAINAGHSVAYNGKIYVNQQLPVTWINPNCQLIIGAGAYIHAETLRREIAMITEATGIDPTPRILIDFRAAVHTDAHHTEEKEAGLHQRMGSTGEGVAAAIKDKMSRSFDYKLFRDTEDAKGFEFADTAYVLYHAYQDGKQILIEGTQGTFLDFHLGEHPYTTSRQTIASAWVAECGLPPTFKYEVIIIARTYPIRVAGNSGALSRELSWPTLARRINARREEFGEAPIVEEDDLRRFEEAETLIKKEMGMPPIPIEEYPPEERKQYSAEISGVHQAVLNSLDEGTVERLRKLFEVTTVTKKLRRIGELDLIELETACRLNGATSIVLNFLNYVFPESVNCKTWADIRALPSFLEIRKYITDIESVTGVPISHINCNPSGVIAVGGWESSE